MAQLNNINGRAKGKDFKDSLRWALKQSYDEYGVERSGALKAVARRLVETALDPHVPVNIAIQAIANIADRLDGKPAQTVTGLEGQPIALVERVIIQQVLTDEVIEGEIVPDLLDELKNDLV